MKKFLSFLLVFLLSLTFIGCDEEEVKPTKITLSETSITLEIGESKTVTCTVSPDEAVKTVTWKSDDDKVATVSNTGKIVAVNSGDAVITVTSKVDETVKAELTVKVNAPKKVEVTSVEINSEDFTLKTNETKALTVKVLPSDATDKSVVWSSNNTSVATVDASGLVKAISEGEAIITCKASSKDSVTDTVKVNVTKEIQEDVVPTGVELTAAKSSLYVSETTKLTAVVTPSDAKDKSVTYTSSDTSIATVDANGLVTAIAEGKVTITVTSNAVNTIKDEIEINITKKDTEVVLPEEITIESGKTTVSALNTLQLSVKVLPENTTDKSVTWSSSDTSIATVDADGLVSAISEGEVVITAKSNANDVEKTITITVTPKVEIIVATELVLSGEELMYTGHTYVITATVTPADATHELVWESDDMDILAIEEVEESVLKMTVTVLDAGDVTISCLDINSELESSISIKCEIAPTLESISVINGRTISVNEVCTLKIQESPAYALYNVTWTSSDESIATIDENGKVQPVKDGKVILTATSTDNPSITASYEMEITLPFDPNAKPDKVIITGPSNITLYVGYSIRLTAEVSPSGVSGAVTWASTNENYATVDANGNVTALAVGTVRIRATSALDENIKSKYITISITTEPQLPEIPDMGGYEIVIMNADSALADIDPFLDGYNSPDKAFKKAAWEQIEDEYNCKIVVKPYPATAPWGPQRRKYIIDNATNGTTQCDFAIVSGAWVPEFHNANAAVDTTAFFGIYGKNQIEQALKEAASYGSTYHAVSNGLNDSRTYVIGGLFYNYGLVKKIGMEKTPAQMFNEGLWTYSGFIDWCLKAQALLAEDEYVLSGGPSIYWAGMVNAAGVKLADKTLMKLNITHDYSMAALDTLTQLVSAGAYDIENIGYDAECPAFQAGKAIFQPGEYWFVRASNRWPEDLWGKGSTEYGYVPFPYPDTVNKNDTKVNFVGESICMMIAGREHSAGIEYEHVYRAVQDMYLRTATALKNSPGYNPEQIKYNFVSSKIDDKASVEATLFYDAAKTMFDPMFDESFQYNYSGPLTTAVINTVKGGDAKNELDAVLSTVEQAFIKVLGQ